MPEQYTIARLHIQRKRILFCGNLYPEESGKRLRIVKMRSGQPMNFGWEHLATWGTTSEK